MESDLSLPKLSQWPPLVIRTVELLLGTSPEEKVKNRIDFVVQWGRVLMKEYSVTETRYPPLGLKVNIGELNDFILLYGANSDGLEPAKPGFIIIRPAGYLAPELDANGRPVSGKNAPRSGVILDLQKQVEWANKTRANSYDILEKSVAEDIQAMARFIFDGLNDIRRLQTSLHGK